MLHKEDCCFVDIGEWFTNKEKNLAIEFWWLYLHGQKNRITNMGLRPSCKIFTVGLRPKCCYSRMNTWYIWEWSHDLFWSDWRVEPNLLFYRSKTDFRDWYKFLRYKNKIKICFKATCNLNNKTCYIINYIYR